MAKTYNIIATTTLSTTANTVTFSSIPSTYTDLVLIAVYSRSGGTGQYAYVRLNGDSASNYSFNHMTGNSSTTFGGRLNNATAATLGPYGSNTSTTQNAEVAIMDIIDYSNTSYLKTVLYQSGAANKVSEAGANLWRNTNAITSLTINIDAPATFQSGNTFTLYGIKAA